MALGPSESAGRYAFKETPDAWETKWQRAMHLPFPLAWMMIGAGLFGLAWVTAHLAGEGTPAILLLAIDAAIIAALGNAVVFFEARIDALAESLPGLLDEPAQKTEHWLHKWYQAIFWSRKGLLLGLALAVIYVVAAALVKLGGVFQSWPAYGFALVLVVFIGLLGGSALWTMLGIAGLMSSLGRDMRIRTSIFDGGTSALRHASSILWTVSLVGAMVYLLGLSSLVVCSRLISPPIVVLSVLAGAFVIAYFIVPQVNIHRTLLQVKAQRLQLLVQQIDTTFDHVAREPTKENIAQLRDLFDLQRIVNGRRAWSFGTGELLMLLGSVFIPLVLFLLRCFLVDRGG
jgi:hypothetical protein